MEYFTARGLVAKPGHSSGKEKQAQLRSIVASTLDRAR
jgi:hypothetical protein